MENNIKSVLKLEDLYFQTISFKRNGIKNEKDLSFQIQADIEENTKHPHLYKITLTVTGEKEEEYDLVVSIVGIFSIDENANIPDGMRNTLIEKNTIAILMPYVRSQISLITAQPGVECVVLPPFNINNIIKSQEKNT